MENDGDFVENVTNCTSEFLKCNNKFMIYLFV